MKTSKVSDEQSSMALRQARGRHPGRGHQPHAARQRAALLPLKEAPRGPSGSASSASCASSGTRIGS